MTTTTRNIIEELKRAATEQGAGEAVRTIAGPALETWMRALDGKDADPERLDDLATLMTARLSIRDAALIAAVEPKLDTATVIDMAARPQLRTQIGQPHAMSGGRGLWRQGIAYLYVQGTLSALDADVQFAAFGGHRNAVLDRVFDQRLQQQSVAGPCEVLHAAVVVGLENHTQIPVSGQVIVIAGGQQCPRRVGRVTDRPLDARPDQQPFAVDGDRGIGGHVDADQLVAADFVAFAVEEVGGP